MMTMMHTYTFELDDAERKFAEADPITYSHEEVGRMLGII